MKIELVVFDIAGTTVADRDNVNDAFRGAFEKAGLPVAADEVNQVMGYRKMEAIRILLQKFYAPKAMDEDLIQSIHEQFTSDMRTYYQNTPDLQALPFATQIFELLHANNIKVALDTGFTKVITDTIVGRLGWIDQALVDMVISSDEVPGGRPHPFMIKAIMERLNITDAGDVVKVGDTAVDIQEGRNAGCGLVIGITSGAYNRDELEPHKPDYIISSLAELPSLLNLPS